MGILLDTARRPANDIALDDLAGGRRTWAQLDERVTRMAHLFRDELGLRAGDHAALIMHNRAEAVELVLGAMLAGVWLTPINHHLTADEVAYVVADSGARVLFADDAHEDVVRAATSAAGGGPVSIRVGDDLERRLGRASSDPLSIRTPPGATMIYTSGTTGRPKGVKRVQATTVADAFAGAKVAGAAIGLDGDGPHLVTGPLYHAAPLLFAVYDLIGGASVLVMPRWDAGGTLTLIEEHRVRHTHLVPTMFVRLLQLPDRVRAAFDPSSLGTVLHGAAPIATHVKRAMIDWWGEVIVEYWGATESGVCTLAGSHDWLTRPGTVGRPTASFDVFAADENGKRLPAGSTGTLCIRHKRFPRPFEYHRDAEKTARAYVATSCAENPSQTEQSSVISDASAASGDAFSIGDIGRVDEDGFVFLTDRASHTIISGGVNVYPAEVENVLHAHGAVADVAVFGIPDDEWGESVKAAIELRSGYVASAALADEILAFARSHLAGYKVPRSIDFEEKLPRHPTGKLYVRRLREKYWRRAGRTI